MPSKRYKKALESVDKKKSYPLKSAVEVLSRLPKAKFNETVELSFRLGVDPKQSDQMVRGTVPLPHGSGKTVKVLVFARPGPAADAAKAVKEVKAGRVEFKIDKAGNVHVPIGKASFTPEQITANARAVIDAVIKAKPHSAKGSYLESCTLSATMSPPVRLDVREFLAAA